jgi:hypothetical protein
VPANSQPAPQYRAAPPGPNAGEATGEAGAARRVQGCGAAAGEGVLLALVLPAGGGPGAAACPGAQVLVLRLGAGEAGGLQARGPAARPGAGVHGARGCVADDGRALRVSWS